MQAGVRACYLPWLPPLWESKPRSQQGQRGPSRPGPPSSHPIACSPQSGQSAAFILRSLALPRDTRNLQSCSPHACHTQGSLFFVLRLGVFPLPLDQASIFHPLCSRLCSCACHVVYVPNKRVLPTGRQVDVGCWSTASRCYYGQRAQEHPGPGPDCGHLSQ